MCALIWRRMAWRLVSSLILVAVSAASVAHGVGAQSGDAQIRLVHASPDAGAVDVWIDGKAVFNGMKLDTATALTAYAAGSHDVAIVPKGGALSAAVLTTTIDLSAGQAYEVAIVDTLQNLSLQLYAIDLTPVASGQVRTRIIQASTDAPSLDVAIAGGPQLGAGLAFLDAGDYVDVPAGTHGLALTEAGTSTKALTVNGVPFLSGKVYDIFVVGRVADNNLTVQPVISNPSTAVGGTTGSSTGSSSGSTQVPATGVGIPQAANDRGLWIALLAALALATIGFAVRLAGSTEDR